MTMSRMSEDGSMDRGPGGIPPIAPDFALQMFADAANGDPSFRISVRLFLGAGVLSGSLVAGQVYFRGLAAMVSKDSDRAPAPDENSMAGVFDMWAGQYEQPDDRNRTIAYVHLQDAWLYAPNAKPMPIGWWRGRLTQVDGWAIGAYTPPKD